MVIQLIEKRKTISYYFLRESGDMVWSRQGFKPNKRNPFIKEVWEIDHSNPLTLIHSLIDGLLKGAKIISIDDIIAKNKHIIYSFYKQYAIQNQMIIENKSLNTWLARKDLTAQQNIVTCGFGKSPIHAIANLFLQNTPN